MVDSNEEEDFFWKVQLEAHSGLMYDLVPDKEEQDAWGSLDLEIGSTIEFQIPYYCGKMNDEEAKRQADDTVLSEDTLSDTSKSITLKIRQMNADGILSGVGGEVWTASLLMASWLLDQSRQGKWKGKHMMELGAGLGVCGLAVAACDSCQPSKITLTDYVPALIENMAHNVSLNRRDNADCTTEVEVKSLDWYDFQSRAGSPRNEQNRDQIEGTVDVIFGSALVYSPEHSCVADVLKFFMETHYCSEAYIIQNVHRIGLESFFDRLSFLNLSYEVCQLPERLFNRVKHGCSIFPNSETASSFCLYSIYGNEGNKNEFKP